MRHLCTLTTLALFLSTAAYAAEVCDPLENNGCVCEKTPVMSEDGKRILYHTMSVACRYTTSGGSSVINIADVKPKPGPGPKPDHNDDDDDDHESDDDNDDHNDGNGYESDDSDDDDKDYHDSDDDDKDYDDAYNDSDDDDDDKNS